MSSAVVGVRWGVRLLSVVFSERKVLGVKGFGVKRWGVRRVWRGGCGVVRSGRKNEVVSYYR